MDISARTVHAVLNAVRAVTGAQYMRLLAQAGWSRFQDQIPPDDDLLVATRAELESLFATIYRIMGEAPMRLFLRNYGHLVARQILDSYAAPTLVAGAAATPEPQKLAWFANTMAGISTRSWTPALVTEDGDAYYLTFERCPLCTGATGAGAPLCAAMDSLYSDLARQLIGHRPRIAEVACAAMGAPACKVAIYK